MKIIAPYSSTHFAILIAGVICAIFVAEILYRTHTSVRKVFAISSFSMIITEIYKQFFLTMVRGGSYSWSDFPFQLCSMPMYLGVFYLFSKKREQQTIEKFVMLFGMMGGIAALVEPTSSFTPYWILTIHSIAWHIWLLTLATFLFLKQKDASFPFKSVMILYVILAIIAVIWNLLFAKISNGTCNMFFLGPSYPDMYILNDIWEKAGWKVETVLMILASLGGAYLLNELLKVIYIKFKGV